MKSICLVPYCPWPAHTGGKLEMMKHLNVLKDLGDCTIVSARSKPVGFGWTPESEEYLLKSGFKLIFREDSCRFSPLWIIGFAYACFFKGLKMERAFGHANPYHRYAFSNKWWTELTRGYDLAMMQYGYWARLKCYCPKVVVLQELLSNYHWGGFKGEARDLKTADLVMVVGHDEKALLESRGISNVLWSPPIIAPTEFPVSSKVALLGTTAEQNVAGLRWLEQAFVPEGLTIDVYGSLAKLVVKAGYNPVGRYEKDTEPYEQCGIHLMTRGDRPGLQIKVVEALAAGRAIVARRGSMRGLPLDEPAWIEVDTPKQLLEEAKVLSVDKGKREALASRAKAFYEKHLSKDLLEAQLRQAYASYVIRG